VHAVKFRLTLFAIARHLLGSNLAMCAQNTFKPEGIDRHLNASTETKNISVGLGTKMDRQTDRLTD
jgi:hypothetical protein